MRSTISPSLAALAALTLFSVQSTALASVERLDLEKFLFQVKGNNPGIKGSIIQTQGSQLRAEEGKLLLAPTAYVNAQYMDDAKLPQFLFLTYDSITTQSLSFGIKKLTTFGLKADLHYDLLSVDYNNPRPIPAFQVSGAGSSFINTTYTNASPVLELTQSLWSNGFGRSTQATQEQLEAEALSSSYRASFQAKSALAEAETHYWHLATARQTEAVQEAALDRAKKIYQWNVRRARLHLRDASDVLQAEASMQSRELELMASKNDVRMASRSFNSDRNIDSDQVSDQLEEIDSQMLDHVQIPVKASMRDDVKAAHQNARASIANSKVALERESPTLDLYASLALNGQQGYTTYSYISDTIGPSFSLNRPTKIIGIRFAIPIDLSLTRNSREGWKQEHIAAELNYDRKVFEQEEKWKELNENLTESKRHLELSRKLESIQKSKLSLERNRLQQGRTTTYQVLLFEQDYLLSQLIRIRDEATILNIIPQMRLFGESL